MPTPAAPDAMLAPVPVADPLQQNIDLDVFQGPFDLLLTLVIREEVDLFELPLAELIEASLGEHAGERWDAATTSELVVVLAAVAELKARRLLGEPEEEEPDPDAAEARERLVARLIAYAPFQAAAAWLSERTRMAAGNRYRGVPLTPAAPAPPAAGDPRELAEALERMFAARPEPSLTHMGVARVSMPELLGRLRNALAFGPDVSFDAVVAGRSPLEEALTLVAALELARRGEVRLSQAVPFGDITIARS
jgi:segregation and condensation protein A